MKVALVQCPSWSLLSPPYNLALLSACLKDKGHEVFCFDFNIDTYNHVVGKEGESGWGTKGESNSWLDRDYVDTFIRRYSSYIDGLVDKILDTQAKVIGFSVVEPSRYFTEEVINRIKEKDRSRIIVLGGNACFKNSIGRDFFDNPNVDALCLQEGEHAFFNFLKSIEDNSYPCFCPGFICRKNGDIIDGKELPLIDDLNKIHFADFSGFDLGAYKERVLPISTSRGCVFRCVFCSESVSWQTYRHRSAKNIFGEMVFQLKRHPETRGFFFNDSLINGDIRMLDELCTYLIDAQVKIYWGGQAAIRKEMTPEFMKKMKRAGFAHVSYGLESASPAILKKMNKRFDLDTAEEVIKNTHKLGIRTTVNIVVGFPGEEEKEVMETAQFLKRTSGYLDDIYFHSLVLMPGSYIYNKREEFDIELPQVNRINLWHTRDGKNDYHVRVGRVEFYRGLLKDKFSSNVSAFNYYLALGDQHLAQGKLEEALNCYNRARNETSDTDKIGLIEKKIGILDGRKN